MAPIVEVRDLVRRFGKLEAVAGLTFGLERGEVLGFIGPNGAGKTTTLRLIATLDQPTSGTVLIDGQDAQTSPTAVRPRIGWLPDGFPKASGMTAWEFLDFFARVHGFTGQERKARLAEIIEFADLGDLLERDVAALSRGMTQRLLLGRALLHDPEVLVMDEPASGLDPKARIEFRRLLRLLAGDGKAVLISSHILSELEEVCDSFLLIDRGRILHHGSAASLTSGDLAVANVLVRVAGAVEPLREWVVTSPGLRVLEAITDGLRLEVASSAPEFVAERLRAMVLAGIQVVEFRSETRRLEEAFVEAITRNSAS
jgi:ABC-2 type transport system ATP-binding protein